MHRYLLYLAVGLLTFGIGSLVVFKFYWIAEDKLIIAEEKQTIIDAQNMKNFGTGFGIGSATNNKQINETVYTPKLHKPTCSDKNLLPVWNELRKNEEFREREKDFYRKADCSEMLEVQKVDLNNDGQKEFVLWGKNFNLCGATGNCALWIYEKKNGKYRLLLQSVAYSDREEKWFEPEKSKSNGYRNLLLKIHFSGYETVYQFYKFNGGKYVEDKCLFYEYMVNIKEPFVMTCKEHLEQSEEALRESEAKLKNQ